MSNTPKNQPTLKFFGASAFIQHLLSGDSSRSKSLNAHHSQNYFKVMILSRSFTRATRFLLAKSLNIDMVRYRQHVELYKLNFLHSSLFVSSKFLVDFFVFVKPQQFGVLFGYDERKVPTEVLDALKGASELRLHCRSPTPSVNYAIRAFGSNLDHLHCTNTLFLRPFIDDSQPLKFRYYSGGSGLFNHLLPFEVEEIEMTHDELFQLDQSEPCPIQPSVRVIKLKHKFEKLGVLREYLTTIKDKMPNLKLLVWNALFNLQAVTITASNLISHFTSTIDEFLTAVRSLTSIVPHIHFQYFRSLRVEFNREEMALDWTRQLEAKGFRVERCAYEMLQNDPHMSVYQRTVKYEHVDAQVQIRIEIGIVMLEV